MLKPLIKNKLILFLVLLNLIGGLIYGGRYIMRQQAKKSANQKVIEDAANVSEKSGVMPREQYITMFRIGRDCQDSGGKTTDADLAYILAILDRKYSSRTEWERRDREKMLAGMQLQMSFTKPTEAQKQVLFDTFVRATASPLDGYAASDSLIVSGALLARFNDTRIAPYLVKLLDYPNKDVKRVARECLKIMPASASVAANTPH